MRSIVSALVLSVLACQSQATEPAEKSDSDAASRLEEPLSLGLLEEKLKLKDGTGAEVAAFKPKDNGAKLVGPDGEELARYTLKGGTIKVKDSVDTVVAWVKGDANKIKLLAPDGETERFSLRPHKDGGYKLKGIEGQLLYELKPRPYGFKVVDEQDQVVAKVKYASGKVSVRDETEVTLYSTKTRVAVSAFATLAFSELSLAERGGLFLKLHRGSR